MIKIATPGRICFFGDHQDYLGLPVIAGTINRYIHIKAKPIQSSFFEVNLLDFKKSIKVEFTNDPKTIKPGDYFRSGLIVLMFLEIYL
jgi:galactokinase